MHVGTIHREMNAENIPCVRACLQWTRVLTRTNRQRWYIDVRDTIMIHETTRYYDRSLKGYG